MSVSGTISLECEARAMIDEKTYLLIKDFYVANAKVYRSFTNTNIYIDTPDLYLVNHHMVLRIRDIDNKNKELTLKVKGESGDNEYTYPLDNEEEYLSLIKEMRIPYQKIIDILSEQGIDIKSLKIITKLVTERIEIPHEDYLFVIDKNYYHDVIDYNLEVEAETKEKAKEYLNELGKPFGVEYKKGYVSKSRRAVLYR